MKAAKMGTVVSDDRRKPMVVSTGVCSLDAASGVGGIPTGRIVIHHGGQSTGKTTAALHMLAEVQRLGGVGCLIDVEQKADFDYAATIGVNIDELVVSPPEIRTIEGHFAMIEQMITFANEEDPDAPVLFVWDSMQASASQKEDKRKWEETGYQGEAGSFSRCIRKLVPMLAHSRAILLFISQVRMDLGSAQSGAQNIGVGKAPLHFATIAFQWKGLTAMGKQAADAPQSNRVGNIAEVLTKKNQAAPPLVTVKVPIRFGRGVDHPMDVLLTAKQWGIVETAGSVHRILDDAGNVEKKLNGAKAWVAHFREHPDQLRALHDRVVAKSIQIVQELKLD